ncbi:MAG: hypothetical protein HQL41_00950 [Alphaproteobacteria bacterium]|nr:hypothetical protein [Alphaproteobacteria bacterium]
MRKAIAAICGCFLMLIALTACDASDRAADALAGRADTPAQRVYRAIGLFEATASWAADYAATPEAAPDNVVNLKAIASTVWPALTTARAQVAFGEAPDLTTAAAGLLAFSAILDAPGSIQAPGLPTLPPGGAVVAAVINRLSQALARYGAARVQMAGLRLRLAVMTDAGRDPTPAEMDAAATSAEHAHQRLTGAR